MRSNARGVSISIYLSLGSNLGNRADNIRSALVQLAAGGDVAIIRESSLYETAPVDYLPQPDFLNNVVEVETSLSAEALLERAHAVEQNFNRERRLPKGPRSIDIDILLFHGDVSASRELEIPHPRMCDRKFVLVPLLEIAPDAYCHRDGRPMAECLKQITDPSQGIRLYHG